MDGDIQEYEINGDVVMAIHVPQARREEKPIYINNNLFGGTFRRNGEGDYHCTQSEVRAMLRDQTEETSDMKTLDDMEIEDLNIETVQAYRSRHLALRPNHVWQKLTDEEYLEQIGAVRRSRNDKRLHPTGAGLLMFGKEYKILYEYPEYFLDYREILDPTIRWTDRLQSSSDDWSGNLFDFFFRVYSKLVKDLKIPFKLEGITRIDDTPVHKAMREALANCLTNADFFVPRGVVIRKDVDKIIIENPGYIRTGKDQMLKGGISDPRNKALMKMFNIIGVGERAGSGVPDIYNVWRSQNWESPIVEEQYNPDRTILTLSFLEADARGRHIGRSGRCDYEGENDLEHSAIKLNIGLEEYAKLISFLDTPRSRKELQEFFGYKSRDYLKYKVLAPLIAMGKIELTVPDKPKSPKQKYVWRKK